MTIFLCEPGYTGILSGIYDAGVSKIPQDELRLEIKKQWAKCRAFCCIQGMQSIRRKREKGNWRQYGQRLNSHIQEQLYVASLSEDVLRADKNVPVS